jgi:hypothetical protein
MEKLNINVNGNRKLRNTDKVRFMIWNLPAVKTCPYRTAMCEKSCYARKAERVYPQVLPSREKNYTDSLQADFVDRMIYTIEKELNTKKCKDKLTVFRIHESGDFYNIAYTEKWIEIAQHFENDQRIVFLAYTKSIWYFINLGYGYPGFPSNLVVRSSLWADTTAKNVTLTVNYEFPIYTALSRIDMDTEKENGHRFTECRCDDCANCGYCWNKEHKDIICEIH